MGVQHLIVMFGSTVLAPILMGFDPNVAVLMSGIGTLIFFVMTGGKVPSYLGSSFAFIGALVQVIGTGWIERLMPPVVNGSVVAVIGLNLAGIPIKNMTPTNFDVWMQGITFVSVAMVAVFTSGMVQRLLILAGLIVASVTYAVLNNGLSLGNPMDLSGIGAAAWFGLPGFSAPVFEFTAMTLIVPVAIILVAENLGHIKAVTAMTGKNLDPYPRRAFMGDGIATMVAGAQAARA